MNTLLFVSKKDIIKVFYFLIFIEIFFVVLYLIGYFLDFPFLKSCFDLDGENNMTSLFSFFQLMFLSMVYFSIFSLKETQKLKLKFFFLIVGLIFVFLSFDEFFMIHERFGKYLKNNSQVKFIGFKNSHGFWILPYVLILSCTIIFLYPYLMRIWGIFKKEAKLIFLGAIIFVFGSIFLEIISYQYLRYEKLNDTFYVIEVIFEEWFEMLGISIILYSSLIIRMELQLKNLKSLDI